MLAEIRNAKLPIITAKPRRLRLPAELTLKIPHIEECGKRERNASSAHKQIFRARNRLVHFGAARSNWKAARASMASPNYADYLFIFRSRSGTVLAGDE
ncbi:MAG: hypothetical protein ABSG65_35420, partial [Bryobacteraceae bacterium]